MIGRRVRSWCGATGTVLRWEPLSAAMTDTLLREESGRECWYSSHQLRPIDDLGPLPSRDAAQREADASALASLEKCRADLVRDWHKRWYGLEHGKAIVGRSIVGAIEDIKRRMRERSEA